MPHTNKCLSKNSTHPEIPLLFLEIRRTKGERPNEADKTAVGGWSVRPSVGAPSFARRGCLLETDTLTVGRT